MGIDIDGEDEVKCEDIESEDCNRILTEQESEIKPEVVHYTQTNEGEVKMETEYYDFIDDNDFGMMKTEVKDEVKLEMFDNIDDLSTFDTLLQRNVGQKMLCLSKKK